MRVITIAQQQNNNKTTALQHQNNTNNNGKNGNNNINHLSIGQNLENSNLFRKPNIPTTEEVERVFVQQGGTVDMAHAFIKKMETTAWYYNNSPVINFASLVGKFISWWFKIEEDKANRNKSQPQNQNPQSVKIVLK